MRNWIILGSLVVAATAWGQPANNLAFELANLREDLRMLNQRVGEMQMTVEQLSREKEALQAKTSQTYVTLEQMNRALADLSRTLQGSMGDQRREILQQVATQIERLGKQTNAALDALAKNQATRPPVQTTFSEDFPQQGVNYTVQAGDTVSSIAQKNGARMQDIINANKLSDPTKIRVGQTLFIPLAK